MPKISDTNQQGHSVPSGQRSALNRHQSSYQSKTTSKNRVSATPPFDPDLASLDFHVSLSMAHFLVDRQFNNIGKVENGLRDFVDSK